MKLSFIFELLLIFVLIAYAAAAARGTLKQRKQIEKGKPHRKQVDNRQQVQDTANRYCSCSAKLCNCCRDFNIPVVALQGPGCASLQFLKGDRLAIAMSFGERVLSNTTISSRRPQPVCVQLPGGITKFCGRVYNVGRQGDHFRACLGLELKTLQEVEAAVRVSCFRFGEEGLRVEPPRPFSEKDTVDKEEDEDDDDDDDEDDEDDEEYFSDEDDDGLEEDDDEDDDVEEDYTSFSLFDDDFIDEYFQSETPSDDTRKKPVKKIASTTRAPVVIKKKQAITKRKPTVAKVPNKPTPVRLQSKPKKPNTMKHKSPIRPLNISLASSTTKMPITKYTQQEIIKNTDSNQTKSTLDQKTSTMSSTITDEITEKSNIQAETTTSNEVTETLYLSTLQTSSESTQETEAAMTPSLPQQYDTLNETLSIAENLISSNEYTDDTQLNDERYETTTADYDNELGETEPNESETTSNSSEESDETDIFSDIVEDIVNESAEDSTKKAELKIEHKSNHTNESSRDVFEDIAEGMVDTLAGDISD